MHRYQQAMGPFERFRALKMNEKDEDAEVSQPEAQGSGDRGGSPIEGMDFLCASSLVYTPHLQRK